jgi:hypothetical protein
MLKKTITVKETTNSTRLKLQLPPRTPRLRATFLPIQPNQLIHPNQPINQHRTSNLKPRTNSKLKTSPYRLNFNTLINPGQPLEQKQTAMKKIVLIASVVVTTTATAQTHKLQKIWETDTIVAVPESVLLDSKQNILYVSLIDGGPWDADGKGGVGKLSPDGKKYNGTWITGLNAPKGLGTLKDKLYVADLNKVVVIDVKKASIDKKIEIEGASGLNDITVDTKGNVFVSDSKTAKIWRITNDVPSIYLENITGANGLKAIGDVLVFAQGKMLQKANAQKEITKIAEVPNGIDGIEPVGNGDFVVTAWQGYVYYVSANGNVETLLDTHAANKNTADIGYDPVKRIIYVPTFNGKTVAAYSLK